MVSPICQVSISITQIQKPKDPISVQDHNIVVHHADKGETGYCH